MWTHAFTAHKGSVGTLEAIYNAGQQDEWRVSFSVDMDSVDSLADHAEKAKAMHAQHLAEKTKPDPYADKLAAFEVALNGGK